MISSQKPDQRNDRFWTPARVLLSFTVLAQAVAFGASSCSQPSEVTSNNDAPGIANAPATASNAPPAPKALTPMPASLLSRELSSVDGKPFKLGDYAGKVLVVDVWATWCMPCRMEIPHLVALNKQYAGKGVEIVGLTTEDPQADAQKVKDFIREFNIDYRVGWANGEFALYLMQGRNSIPQSYVITRDGHVLKRFVGFDPSSTPALLREAVEQAVNYKSGT